MEYFAQNEHLRARWDGEKNAPLTPAGLKSGSKTPVWWRCPEGHSWQARVDSMTGGTGGDCPYCSGRRAIPGQTDLATLYPELAAQWDSEKNGNLTPTEVRPGSGKQVWWRCPEGHSFQASPHSRTKERGTGCPYCSGAKILPGFNDLASLRPDLASQWDGEKNGELTPDRVTLNSNRRVWWKCGKGHSWQTPIYGRTKTKNAGCPACSGGKALPGVNDLATLRPDIAVQWHHTLNGELKPDRVTVSSNRRVWWRCGEGHVWQALIYGRTKAKDPSCPVCSGAAGARKLHYFEVSTTDRTGPNPESNSDLRTQPLAR